MEASARNTNSMGTVVYGHWFARRTVYRAEASRNGPVFSVQEPVLLRYDKPWERVNFCPVRDANPFFHLVEALWMMAGRRDVAFLTDVLPRMVEYSDDGHIFNAAYGYRLFEEWGDQLTTIGRMLQNDPTTRHCVAQLWRASDLVRPTKDKACNTQLMFRVVSGAVDMTVINRSNDAIWGGVSGANVVHFSVFQEYVARMARMPMGRMYVFSTNFHVYDNEQCHKLRAHYASEHGEGPTDLYSQHLVTFTPWIDDPTCFRHECVAWCDEPERERLYANAFLSHTATPMYRAYKAWREGGAQERSNALAIASSVQGPDWRRAALDWMSRRHPRTA